MQDKNYAELFIFELYNKSKNKNLPVKIYIINVGSPEYQQVLDLRNEVLRKPLGLVLSERDIENDKNEWIVIAKHKGRVVACVQLRPLSEKEIKLRQMAVFPEYQSRAWGRRLLEYAEQLARNESYHVISLHARATATGFYRKAAYQIVSDEFIEVGIPHYKMQKQF